MKPTHIWMYHELDKTIMLFRADSGIMIGMQQNCVVIFGEEPNKRKSFGFIDQDHARKWLKETYPAQDLKIQGIDGEPMIEERSGEGLIVMPPDSLVLPNNGSMTPFRN